jgi:biotin transport system permease protein
MAFVGLTTPMETGRAAAWFLRPFLGHAAWKPALCIALTAWFLPLTMRLSGQVRSGMRSRGLRLPWRRRVILLVGASLRILEKTAGEVAVGLASRRLDDWRSW